MQSRFKIFFLYKKHETLFLKVISQFEYYLPNIFIVLAEQLYKGTRAQSYGLESTSLKI